MKTASTTLINLLASRQFFSVDLYQFSLVGGGVLNYCSGDADINWNGITWSTGGSSGPYFDRSDSRAKCRWKIGVEVDSLVFDVIPGSASIFGTGFLSAVRQGMFDGAELTLYRAFMSTYGDTADGAVIMFAGRVAEIDATRSLATFTVNSHLELLNQNLPRNIYQASCLNSLFDSGCGLNKATFTVSGSALSGSTSSVINASLGQASGYFDMGTLSFTSGANDGLSRTVKSYIHSGVSSVSLVSPFPGIVNIGDSFSITAGCDKQQATCSGKFNNISRFRGFPYVPENETAV